MKKTGLPPSKGAIDPRLRDRRTEVTRAAGRRRLRALVRVLVAVAMGAGVVALVRSPLLDVDTVRVKGAKHTATAAVADAARLGERRTAMLTLDRRAMAGRIEALPWVASAAIDRQWPSTVVIRVVERVPVATVPVTNGVAILDADGRILGTATTAPPGLVSIGVAARLRVPGENAEATVRQALSVVLALPARLANQVKAVGVVGDATSATFDLDLNTGVKVMLGPATDVDQKLRAALAVLDARKPSSGAVLDVRVPRSPTLRPG